MNKSVVQFLRHPKTIVGEVAVVGCVCGAGVTLPLCVDSARLRESHPAPAAVCKAAGLDNQVGGLWFLIPLAFAGASLGIVVYHQLRRLSESWSFVPTPEQLRSAPYRAECGKPLVNIRTSGRLGLIGSPPFQDRFARLVREQGGAV